MRTSMKSYMIFVRNQKIFNTRFCEIMTCASGVAKQMHSLFRGGGKKERTSIES